jgi:uncharacterized PurR-regulated membrane protein YhhQ (DUF165 family)
MTAKIAAGLGFIATILAANYVTTQYGMVPVGFGLMATAGTYCAGLTFVLRDLVQDGLEAPADRVTRWLRARGIRWTPGRMNDSIQFAALGALIVAGAALSYAVSAPAIALASATAFLLSESADFAVYSPLRDRGYIRAALASNFVGAVVDTAVFLGIAGFPLSQAFAGQMAGKVAVTLAVVVLVAGIRITRRPVTA